MWLNAEPLWGMSAGASLEGGGAGRGHPGIM